MKNIDMCFDPCGNTVWINIKKDRYQFLVGIYSASKCLMGVFKNKKLIETYEGSINQCEQKIDEVLDERNLV